MSEIRRRLYAMAEDDVLMCLEPGAVLDQAILGLLERCGQPPVVCYDYDKLIQGFMADGMTYEEAVEWYAHNTAGSWVGEQTPAVLRPLPEE